MPPSVLTSTVFALCQTLGFESCDKRPAQIAMFVVPAARPSLGIPVTDSLPGRFLLRVPWSPARVPAEESRAEEEAAGGGTAHPAHPFRASAHPVPIPHGALHASRRFRGLPEAASTDPAS